MINIYCTANVVEYYSGMIFQFMILTIKKFEFHIFISQKVMKFHQESY